MTIPSSYASRLADEAVGATLLVEVDTTEGFLRFLKGENGRFTDVNGVEWIGSEMIQIGEVSVPRNGSAPAFEIGVEYTPDPDGGDLISIIRQYGVAAIEGRKLKVYFQYFGKIEEMFAPIEAPYLLSTHVMRSLKYSVSGPKSRMVAVTCEGPFPLRSKPAHGRYTVTDHQRRTNSSDESLKFWPTNAFGEELFGL